jgi:hypothetical protein
VARLLRKLDLTRLQPRPYHPKNDAAAQGAFNSPLTKWLRHDSFALNSGTDSDGIGSAA